MSKKKLASDIEDIITRKATWLISVMLISHLLTHFALISFSTFPI